MTRYIKDLPDRPPVNVKFRRPGRKSFTGKGHIIKGPVDGVIYLVDHDTGGCRTIGSQYAKIPVVGPKGGVEWVRADTVEESIDG